MPLRMIEVYVPQEAAAGIEEGLADQSVEQVWVGAESDSGRLIKVLAETGKTEAILDWLEQQIAHVENARIVLLEVQAMLPRPPPPEPEPQTPAESAPSEPGDEGQAAKEESGPDLGRISREELYNDIAASAGLSWRFVTFVVVSAVIATIGIVKDSEAIVIGSMVVAPLLGPNMAMALATTLADLDLALRSAKASAVGAAIGFALAAIFGVFVGGDHPHEQIISRTVVDLGDVFLSLAAGVAGAMAFTTGAPASVMGVMVAVALLPPLVVAGLLFGAGNPQPALAALLLLATNVICINLAAVVTFLVQGIRPRLWWEADRAKRATRRAIILWTGLLVVLVVLIVLFGSNLALEIDAEPN